MPHQSTDQATQSTTTNNSRDSSSDTDGPTDGDSPPDSAIHVLEDLPSLPLDQVFEVLKNERRRRVLEQLSESDDTLDLGTLAEEIAALENDKHVRQITSTERKRVYVGLYQCHLPKMDDTDVIDFDGNRGTVDLGDNAEQLYPFLEAEAETERPWPQYYLGHSALSLVAFIAAQLAVPVAVTAVFAVSLVGFVLLGGAQLTAT